MDMGKSVMTVRPPVTAVVGIWLLLALTGCSVGMAMTGTPDPYLGAVHVGARRTDVDFNLGYPIEVVPGSDGTHHATYEYEIGNAPDTRRAEMHAALDIVTLGAWELFGTIIEASQGSTERILIVYGPNNRVKDIIRIEELRETSEKEASDGDTPAQVGTFTPNVGVGSEREAKVSELSKPRYSEANTEYVVAVFFNERTKDISAHAEERLKQAGFKVARLEIPSDPSQLTELSGPVPQVNSIVHFTPDAKVKAEEIDNILTSVSRFGRLTVQKRGLEEKFFSVLDPDHQFSVYLVN